MFAGRSSSYYFLIVPFSYRECTRRQKFKGHAVAKKTTKLTKIDGSNKTCSEVWLRHGDLSIAVMARGPWKSTAKRGLARIKWLCGQHQQSMPLRTACTESDNTDRFLLSLIYKDILHGTKSYKTLIHSAVVNVF